MNREQASIRRRIVAYESEIRAAAKTLTRAEPGSRKYLAAKEQLAKARADLALARKAWNEYDIQEF